MNPGDRTAVRSRIDSTILELMSKVPGQPVGTMPDAPPSQHRINKSDLGFRGFQEAYRFYAVSLSTIDGISAGTLVTLMSELGTARDILSILPPLGQDVIGHVPVTSPPRSWHHSRGR